LGILLMGVAHAQTVYRIVGPDGKITFSDKPPFSPEQGKVAGTGVGAGGSSTGNSLPFELRQIAAKFPVTLYTSAECQPCVAGRSMLTGRGVPFTERTVNTPDDVTSLQRISGGDTALPLLTVGGQKIRGFSDSEWAQYLDLAGYPKASTLSSTYKNPMATPLVAVQAPEAAKPKVEPPTVAPTPAPAPAVTPDNPAGIKF
jgi:glutaredoxin